MPSPRTISYLLDNVGNRLQRTSTHPAVAAQSLTYNANDWLDSDTMDANGNTVQATVLDEELGTSETVNDSYDFENRLIRRDKPDGSAIEILYNGDGDRIAKHLISAAGVTNRIWYLVDRNNLTGYAQVVEELQSFSGVLNATCAYTYGLDLVSQDRWNPAGGGTGGSWNVSYYTYDGHGSVRQLTDDVGITTDTYTYDAFGKLIEQTVLNPTSGLLEPITAANRYLITANAYRYCGEQYDTDLKMVFLRARYMNTDSGRFWSMDTFQGWNSTPVSLHKYLYTHADPVNGSDPSGEMTMTQQLTTGFIISLLSSTVAVPAYRQTLGQSLFFMIIELDRQVIGLTASVELIFAIRSGAGKNDKHGAQDASVEHLKAQIVALTLELAGVRNSQEPGRKKKIKKITDKIRRIGKDIARKLRGETHHTKPPTGPR